MRVSLLENLAKLAKAIGEEATIEHIIPEIEKLCADPTWRVRLAAINYIPELLDFISPERFDQKILPLIQTFQQDSVHEIRVRAVQVLLSLV